MNVCYFVIFFATFIKPVNFCRSEIYYSSPKNKTSTS